MAKRLQSLGALTQGDRDATAGSSTMSAAAFNVDTKYGHRALHDLCNGIQGYSKAIRELPVLDDALIDELQQQLAPGFPKDVSLSLFIIIIIYHYHY